MRLPYFSAQPVDESFFASAPFLMRDSFDIAWPAEQFWTDLTSDTPLEWCRILQSVKWTSPRPFGVGTTRTARALGGVSVINERFFRWEDGRRYSFYAVNASTPMFRRWAEDYLVEPVSESSSRFTWTIAIEPRHGARITNPINRKILNTLFTDTHKHYGASRPLVRG